MPADTTCHGVHTFELKFPPTALYESPIVFIFSTLYFVVISSNAPKQVFISSTNCCGVMVSEISVNPLKSVNSTVTCS